MVHHNGCPLCSSQALSLKFNVRDYFVTGEVFPVVTCDSCGFLFTQDYPEENEMTRYYDSGSYISHSNSSEGIVDRLYQLIRQVMLKRKTALVRRYAGKSEGSILDVGCGTGHFLDAMKKDGWNSAGIEINPAAREFAVSKFNLTVYQSADHLPPDSQFDCITLWHVLEHFHKPEEYILSLKKRLKPAGVLIIALPNSGSFDASHYKDKWAAYDVPRHLWHFNPFTFKIFAENSGIRLMAMKYLPFDVFYISILSEKYRNSKISLLSGLAIGAFFWFLSLFNRNRTSSVIYISK
ncbi:MAG TPA: class I SAM-dependent methyltransferase [Bacteroidales bacterium]|nr:class I SAM-dependent methyltransferase [Bacteroidales bacterium]